MMECEPDNELGRRGAGSADLEGSTLRRPVGSHAVRSVLLALTDSDYPSAALQHAGALAQWLEAELHVMRVLPREQPFFATFAAELDIVHATRRVERCLAAARDAKTWCDDLLPEPLSAQRLRIRIGNFIDEVASYAAELRGALIVIPPSTGRLGRTAMALARASSRSVLVARPSAREATVLAATDLEDDDSWVLHRAADLAAQLGASVVALHNVSCLSRTLTLASPVLAAVLPPPGADQLLESRLRRATERLAPLSTIVTNDIDPVDAILEQARVHRVYTIVVGTRPRSWLERFVEPSVAVEVVNRADRSVLVTPCPPYRLGLDSRAV